MKAIIEFDLNEDQQAFDDFIHSRHNRDNDQYVWNEVFRPNEKHGYGKVVDDLIDKCGKTVDEDGEEVYYGAELIDTLSDMYVEIKGRPSQKPRFRVKGSVNLLAIGVAVVIAFLAGYSVSFIVEIIKISMS